MIKIIMDNWSELLVSLVGLSAFVIFFLEKNDKKHSAATLVIGQIDLIEKRVMSLKEEQQLGNIAIYHSKPIIKGQNMWEEYKHLFVKKLSRSEYDNLQQFFDNAEQLERARQEILTTIANAWSYKSEIEQQNVAQYIVLAEENPKVPMADFQRIYRALDLVFTPDIVIASLTKNLNNFKCLSGSTAYQKIQKYSYNK